MTPEYAPLRAAQWQGQKQRPTQFGDRKNAPDKSYEHSADWLRGGTKVKNAKSTPTT
jgi:hypothetical protein